MTSSQRDEWMLLGLLRAILRRTSSVANSPLQLELSEADIVASAIESEQVRRDLAKFSDPAAICQSLDRLLQNLVDVHGSHAPQHNELETHAREVNDEPREILRRDELANRLAAWLLQCRTTLVAVHPRAMKMVCLRSEGYHHRDIAQRLDLGLRQSERIARDILEAIQALPVENDS